MENHLRQAARWLIERALEEDVAGGDLTTEAVFPGPFVARAVLTAREELVPAGLAVAAMVFEAVDPSLRFTALAQDGRPVKALEVLAEVRGDGRSILTGERVAVNFLQRLSGIATLTSRYVAAVRGHKARIVDTRKTLPAWRALEKYAVRLGGGLNHRFNLSSGILIKDNHVDLAGSLSKAVETARRSAPHPLKIEVEARNLEEVREALEAGADIILLDNFSPEEMRRAVERIGGKALTEASGGMTLSNVAAVAATGVDYISVGALTHSAAAVDICLDIKK